MKESYSDIETLVLTKQRKVVLRVIREAKEHLTANEVFEKAKPLLPKKSPMNFSKLCKFDINID